MKDPREHVRELLDALLAAPDTAVSIPQVQISPLLIVISVRQSELAAAQSALAARLLAELPPPANTEATSDRLLTIAQAAEILSVEPEWVTRHANRLPFVHRLGPRVLRVSEPALRAWMAKKAEVKRR